MDRGCHVVSTMDQDRHILGFLDRSRYYFFQVAPQLYSRGWVDPIPDPLLRKSGSAGNQTWDLWICSQELWSLYHRGSWQLYKQFLKSWRAMWCFFFPAELISEKRFAFGTVLSFGNREKLAKAKSGEYGACSMVEMLFPAKNCDTLSENVLVHWWWRTNARSLCRSSHLRLMATGRPFNTSE
jgi:hypothetical protein